MALGRMSADFGVEQRTDGGKYCVFTCCRYVIDKKDSYGGDAGYLIEMLGHARPRSFVSRTL